MSDSKDKREIDFAADLASYRPEEVPVLTLEAEPAELQADVPKKKAEDEGDRRIQRKDRYHRFEADSAVRGGCAAQDSFFFRDGAE